MATVDSLTKTSFDYCIVGGGTAGCVIASRLATYLPHAKILLIEAGPSDLNLPQVLNLRKWLTLLGGEFDFDYGTTEQARGNSHIRHSRAKLLGGCSSHNTLISYRPFRRDMEEWESLGAAGWSFKEMTRALDRLRNNVTPIHPRHRNQLVKDWIKSASTALDIPIIDDFNATIRRDGQFKSGTGFFSISYNPEDNSRSSASVAYIHPILKGEEHRPNLTIVTNAWVSKINFDDSMTARSLDVKLASGESLKVHARTEIILCAGAIDTPRLLLHSGVGPKAQLDSLEMPVLLDAPGVGKNLQDHPESIIMFEMNRPVPQETTMDSDAGVFICTDGGKSADVMMHCYQIPFTLNTARLGYDTPTHAFCMTPNIPRSQSRGQVYLTSSDPSVKPALDFKYFEDEENYDEKIIIQGLKAARKIAAQAPFSEWIKREVAPGPSVQTDEELGVYGRQVAHTVYHPAGTCKMGSGSDASAVTTPDLKVKGTRHLRIADASVFPSMVSINPMLTVLGIGERCAEFIAEEAGWARDTARL
ncbi:protein of unknown function [Taphrina deformans PYCC 5710]|uniref:Glucose-methanol-choline oxidoreductase N-terminal domain-containing protein n=1 Tax=Taphrina deformans (strain PYCC 5710 / ATCC 11124 / CBS 356.35 / IMI 108563 / JCM 9778 / NBRC 8474) TaxID=1097556 RepID=R4XEI7_TAPDE|nr:protein of unknown function [Taphrina deformans PYCC 5710]|eukprot:CCG84257.1 protein of unknown function [Taphrina deformans PYCC 5710]